MAARPCRPGQSGLKSGNTRFKKRKQTLGAGQTGYHLDRLQPPGGKRNAGYSSFPGSFPLQFQRQNIPGHRPAHDHGGIQCRQSFCRCSREGRHKGPCRQNQLCPVSPAQIIRLAGTPGIGTSSEKTARYIFCRSLQTAESDNSDRSIRLTGHPKPDTHTPNNDNKAGLTPNPEDLVVAFWAIFYITELKFPSLLKKKAVNMPLYAWSWMWLPVEEPKKMHLMV